VTYQDACVWVSAVPVVLLVTLSWVPPPQRKVTAASLSLRISRAEPVVVEVPGGGEVGRHQHWVDRMVSKHGSPSCSLRARRGLMALGS
jgi:hypothetical protein